MNLQHAVDKHASCILEQSKRTNTSEVVHVHKICSNLNVTNSNSPLCSAAGEGEELLCTASVCTIAWGGFCLSRIVIAQNVWWKQIWRINSYVANVQFTWLLCGPMRRTNPVHVHVHVHASRSQVACTTSSWWHHALHPRLKVKVRD